MPSVAAGLRLDYVSPLPPVRSGVADYSRDLLPHLARRPELGELRVVRLPGQPVAAELDERWSPVEAGETGADGRLPLYQMGNNRYHEAVLDLAMERPGVLVLHDLVLHHLAVERTLSRGVFDPYLEQLVADHGWVGRAVATTRRWGGYSDAGLFALPAHRTLLRRQRGVLVHSAWAAGLLAEEDAELAVRVVPMGVPLPADAGPPRGETARRARRELGLPEDAPVLGSFGFQTPIKRTLASVRALAAPGLERVHLLVVGEVAPQVDLAGEAERLGVAARVTVTGFVDYARFERALAACDLAVNLRHPTAGETSASLLRLLAAGRGSLVSDYAQFAELPAEVAVRVPLGDEEVPALAALLPALLDDGERLAAMGEAARRLVTRDHDPATAAAAVATACVELADRQPPGDRPAAPPPASTVACRRLDGEIVVAGAEAPWPAGERRRLALTVTNHGACRWLAARRGPGGVAFEVRLAAGVADHPGAEVDPDAGRPWLPLPRDLAPGEREVIELDLRRPPGPARLLVEPVVLTDDAGTVVERAGESGCEVVLP
ncbi:MAG TPA: glycosyltransferase [Thermoanaerobaculia bacterium]|nr:glycosyltransferase [Thermoanaerobaculia bacterium]